MSKGLEALYVLWESKQECSTSCNDMCLKCQKAKAREIIEKELKEYELLMQTKILINPKENDSEYRKHVIKRLMAFEIIKEICVIKFYDDMQSVLIRTPDNVSKKIKLKEEYDLLKEVLL